MEVRKKPEDAILDCLRKKFIGKQISVCFNDGPGQPKTEIGMINDVIIDFSDKFRNFFFITDNLSLKKVEAKDGLCKIENISGSKIKVLHGFKPEIFT